LDLFGPPRRVLAMHTEPVPTGGAIATILDITERTRLDAVRTDFVANISHELKTPVGAISLLAETLADADDAETAQRLAGRLIGETERLTRTIEDLLELSRIELGGGGSRERVDAASIIDESVERVHGLAELGSIRVIVTPSPATLTLLGDRRQLVSALGNLVENAVKYSDEGGVVEVGVERTPDEVVFMVTDHGLGIATQHLDRIFERFYRVDKARSRDTGGVGLGLAIVRHVAANHGGEVNVTSQEGEGSTFRLRIPVAPDMMSAMSAAPAENRVG
jgi:two-component system sensor histidine kinase SenX3